MEELTYFHLVGSGLKLGVVVAAAGTGTAIAAL